MCRSAWAFSIPVVPIRGRHDPVAVGLSAQCNLPADPVESKQPVTLKAPMTSTPKVLTSWDEASRLEALRALKLLDTPPERRFDRVTQMAREVLNVPIALITLVDKDRQWFKSRQGLELSQSSREISFCSHAILQDDIFVVPDACLDPRFCENVLVTGAPHIRFYAGKPLYSVDGKKIGTLCIIDHVPRVLSESDRDRLDSLAAWAEREVNLYSADAEALFRLENRLRLANMLEYAAEGMFTATVDGTIESINPAACEMFRIPAQELIGRNILTLIPARDHAEHHAFMDSMRIATQDQGRASVETTGVRSNGTEFPMAVAFSMLESGQHQFFTGIIRDITELREQKRIKSEFVASVSHEIRTPLTSIIGALSLLRDDLAEGLVVEARALVDIAYSNSQRLNALINDILDIEKSDAGMMEFHPVPCQAAELIDEVCAVNMPFARMRRVRLQAQTVATGLLLRIDRSRFNQVLTNLISNACKFSPGGTTVTVSALRRGDHVRFQVSDQGAGVPDEFRSRIFQRFAQAQPSRNHGNDGTGLGLNLSKELVERMGGAIGFTSIAGGGATFYVDFPLSEANSLHS